MSTIYGDGFVADRFDCPAWHERAVAKDADRVSDAANEADRRNREAEYADTRTREIRKGIAGLGPNITELEVGAIVSSLIGVINRCGWSHTVTGENAMERLLDAQGALEGACE